MLGPDCHLPVEVAAHHHKELPSWSPTATTNTDTSRADYDDAITDSSTFRGSTGLHSPTRTPLRSPTIQRRRSSLSNVGCGSSSSPPSSYSQQQDSHHFHPTVERTLYLIRHGESLTNVTGASQQCFDPCLSSGGLNQCMDLSQCFNSNGVLQGHHDSTICRPLPPPHVAFTSPLTRALQTATLVFGGGGGRGDRNATTRTDVVCLEDLREVVGSGAIAERRRPTCELEGLFPSVDFGCLQHNHDPFDTSSGSPGASHTDQNDDAEVKHLTSQVSKQQPPGESSKCLRERAAKMLFFLLHLPPQVQPSSSSEAAVEPTPHAIVSHFHFLNYLIERMVCAQQRQPDDPTCGGTLEATDCWSKQWPNTGLVKVTLQIAFPLLGQAHLVNAQFDPLFEQLP